MFVIDPELLWKADLTEVTSEVNVIAILMCSNIFVDYVSIHRYFRHRAYH